MYKKILGTALLLFMFFAANAQHKVVMHVSSNDTLAWKSLMNNIRNMKASWGDSVKIEIVAHGPGLDLLTSGKTTQHEKILQYKKGGTEFFACESTMAERKIPKEAIIPEAGFVKMAIVHLVRRQEEGWTYVKAGF